MRELELSQFYVTQFVALLGTPWGIAGLCALIALFALVVTVPAMRWVCLTALLYIATIPLTAGGDVQYLKLAFPLEQFRAFGRPLIYLMLVLLLIPLVASNRGWRRRTVAVGLVFFFAFELLVSLRLVAFGNVFRGMLSVTSYGLIMLTLGIGLSRWLQTMEDCHRLVTCLAVAGGLVALGTCYQLAVNRSLIIVNNRLVGVTGNPQFFGIIIAYTLPFACYLLSRPSGRAWIKPLLVAQVSIMIVMLVWTGSRMGALSSACALIVLFHRRLGRFAITGTVIAVVVYLVMPFFEGSSAIASRLIWTTNTRAGVWAYMWSNFVSAPFLGVSRETFETAESSYLAMLSQFGIFGSLPCLLAVVLLLRQLFGLNRLRSRLGPESGLVDLILAIWTAVGVTSIFEGLLMGVITYPALMIYTVSALTTFVQDWAETDETYALAPESPYGVAA